jgi:hypothetical protein
MVIFGLPHLPHLSLTIGAVPDRPSGEGTAG